MVEHQMKNELYPTEDSENGTQLKKKASKVQAVA